MNNPQQGKELDTTLVSILFLTMKRIRRTLKEIDRKLRKRRARRCRLSVWEDDEAGWWRRRRRSTTQLWIPEFPALPEIKQVEEEKKEDSDEGEEVSNDEEAAHGVEEVAVDHHFPRSDSIETEESVEEGEMEVDLFPLVEHGQSQPHFCEEKTEKEPLKGEEVNVLEVDALGHVERALAQLLPSQNLADGEKGTTEEMERCRRIHVAKEFGPLSMWFAGEVSLKIGGNVQGGL